MNVANSRVFKVIPQMTTSYVRNIKISLDFWQFSLSFLIVFDYKVQEGLGTKIIERIVNGIPEFDV